eukprot:GFUD01026935.1.p1 GENE.GFUD01026935.1~~GFUD01026935.1.p1  ORF type:complete len:479 (-),score=121.39 GFUD01026935.1:192-1628(-)
MSPPLYLDGQVSGNTLELSWTRPSEYNSFNIRIDKCDAKVDCYTIHDETYSSNNMSITDEIFSQCTIYNIHIEAMSGYKQTLRDEINITNKTPECYLTEELVLVVGFTILGILIIGAVGMACYYQRKNPLHNINRSEYRIRSRLYSRLYSQERYQNPIRKSEFKDVMEMKMNESVPFATEFDRLEKLACDTIERKTCVAEFPSSRRRNRYKDIVPYDSNRVMILPPYSIAGDSEPSDYINASFISDVILGTSRKYIAAQGPGEETTPAFWSMIWQYDIRVVVMLTNLVEGGGFTCIKCNMYWPESVGDTKRFGDIEVQLFDKAEAPNYIVRKLDVTHRGPTTCSNRVIVHIQFTNWLDRSAPEDAGNLIQLVQLTRVMYNQFSNKQGDTPSPLLVHCSAGVGRTGTFVCVDQIMRSIDSSLSTDVDIFHTVYQLRRDRRYMVQTRAQYEYVYKCVEAYLAIKEKKMSGSSSSPSISPV